MGFTRIGLFCAVAAFLCMVFFWGCEKQKEAEVKDQATLEAASFQYWNDRLVTRNYKPAYNREADNASMSFDEYRKLVSRNENFKFSGVKIERVTIENDDAVLYVSLKCHMPSLPALDRTLKDQWVYQSDQWKHKFSENQP